MKRVGIKVASAVMSTLMVMSTAAVVGTVNAATMDLAKVGNTVVSFDLAKEDETRSNIIAFIARLYKVCLDREGADNELNYWADELIGRRATGVSVANGFIMSDEFQGKKCTDNEYVAYMYNACFGREADKAEIDYWVGEMKKGMTREAVFVGFATSPEFEKICNNYGVVRGDYFIGGNLTQIVQVNLFVDRFYTNVLERTCDAAGMTYWTQELIAQRLTGSGVAQGFIFSPEFKKRNLCNEHYIKVLYSAFMGREYDEGGLRYWVDCLEHGKTREEAFNGYVASPEFTDICTSYGIMRGNPEATGNTVPTGDCTMPHTDINFRGMQYHSFVGDYAIVDGYFDDNHYGYVLIDKTGEVIRADYYDRWSKGEGLGSDKETTNLLISDKREVMNTKGEIINLEKIGIDANTNFSLRGDMIHWEKVTSGFSGNTYEYHFYNAFTKKDLVYKPDHKINFVYQGNNIFTSEENFSNSVRTVIFGNVSTRQEFPRRGDVYVRNGFYSIVNTDDNSIKCIDKNGNTIFDAIPKNESEFKKFSELYFDGRYVYITSDGMSFWSLLGGNVTVMIDFKTGVVNNFRQSDTISSAAVKPGKCYDGVFANPLAGKDGNPYIALMDINSNLLMDPVRYRSYRFYNGKLYVTPLDGGQDVYDSKGHLISSSNSGESMSYGSGADDYVLMENKYYNADTREEIQIHFTEDSKLLFKK